jgi:hypothetical protein
MPTIPGISNFATKIVTKFKPKSAPSPLKHTDSFKSTSSPPKKPESSFNVSGAKQLPKTGEQEALSKAMREHAELIAHAKREDWSNLEKLHQESLDAILKQAKRDGTLAPR